MTETQIEQAPPDAPAGAASLEAVHARIREESRFVEDLLSEIGRVIVGQRAMVDRLLVGLLADGHVLLEGVPGLAKTLAVRTLASTIDSGFQRIQFTPDLLPADLIGTMIYSQRTGEFTIQKGPLFTNVLLADEINRAPAKVQSALLEAMQENQVTIGDESFALPQPFLVLATQNPLEHDGTYPLPEAQVDRFMLKLSITYPNRTEELEILERNARTAPIRPIAPVADVAQVLRARQVVDRIYVDDKVKRYIVDIVFATRQPREFGLDLASYIDFGASPRASIYLALAAKAYAFLQGRGYVTPQDVKSIGMDVLRHRILTTYEAEAAGVSAEDLVAQVFDHLPVP